MKFPPRIVLMAAGLLAMLAACSGEDLGRMAYHTLAKTCDNQEPADRSCGL